MRKINKANASPAFMAEESLRKRFKKELLSKFCKAINEYDLISPNDKIAVCISGGKDSFLMAKLFQELKRRNKFPFELVFLCMDPGYSPKNRALIESNAKLLEIPLTIFETNIFENVFNVEKSPCYLCARMRRGHLYAKAKELGCNKIALGHHYDDVIETILMGMLYSGQFQTMMPKLKSKNFQGMALIRPMYLIREEDVKLFAKYNNLNFLQCACKFTEMQSSTSTAQTKTAKNVENAKIVETVNANNKANNKNVENINENKINLSCTNENVETISKNVEIIDENKTNLSCTNENVETAKIVENVNENKTDLSCTNKNVENVNANNKADNKNVETNTNVQTNLVAHGEIGMRQRIKNLIAELKAENPLVEGNIFKSVENVNLSTLISYKDFSGTTHRFTDTF